MHLHRVWFALLLAGLLLAAVVLAVNYPAEPAPTGEDPAESVRHPPSEAPWTHKPLPTAVTTATRTRR